MSAIQWEKDLGAASRRGASEKKLVLLDFFHPA